MAIHRIKAAFARQDWFAVAIEFTSVLLGVLIGVQVSNWNDQRRHQAQVRQVIGRLLPEFRQGAADQPFMERYFANREALGRRADALWNQPGHDDEFFKSAYLTGGYAFVPDFDREGNAMRIGRDTVAQIDDDQLRDSIAALLGLLNDDYLRFSYIDSDYRRTVRRIVPSDIQKRMGEECNHADTARDLQQLYSQPCALALPPEVARQLAAELRANPVALGQLREHLNRLDALNSRIRSLGPLYKAALSEMEQDRRVSSR